MLKLVEVTKDYPVAGAVVHALKGISVNFRKSEFVSVLGPSGCGKTTMLNILGGLDRYTDGDLVIGDRSTRDFRSRDWDAYRNHSVGFVFQSYNLIPHLTVLQNVELALTISGMSRKKKKALASDALLRVGLGGMLKKKPNQLSGGQMQRVAIARAIVNNPEIILADEPTGALDSTTSVQIMDLLQEIADDKLVVMVTHNPDLAERYSTRIIELYDGEIVSDSNPYDGLPTMLSPVTAAETRSPLEEYIEHAEEISPNADSQTDKNRKKGAKNVADRTDAETAPAAADDSTADVTSDVESGTDNPEKTEGNEKFVAVVSPEHPQKLKKRSGQPKEKKQRASMSFFTAIGLSARNLVTKKTRTILTAFAGSIGIIGIALVLSMSNGFSLYMNDMEQNIIASMPVTIASTGIKIDVNEAMQMPSTDGQFPEGDFVTPYEPDSGWQGVEISANIITDDYVDYVRDLDPTLVSAVQYKHSASMRLVGHTGSNGRVKTINSGTVNWQELLWDDFITSQYDVLYGHYPGTEEAAAFLADKDPDSASYSDGENYDGTKARQVVLVVSSYNTIDVGILQELGIYPGYLMNNTYDKVDFSDIVGTQFEVVGLDNRYAPVTDGEKTVYTEREAADMADKDGNVTVTVVGILRIKQGVMMPFLSSGIAYTEDLTNLYLEKAAASSVGKAQINNTDYNILTGDDFTEDVSPVVTMAAAYGIDEATLIEFVRPTLINALGNDEQELKDALNAAKSFSDLINIFLEGKGLSFSAVRELLVPILAGELGVDAKVLNTLLDSAYTNALQKLGASDLPSAIYIYPKNFAEKDEVLAYLDAWNTDKPSTEQIHYTDLAGTFSEVMTRVVGIVSYILIAFSAISLIVSSVMIGIITYVSVLERTTEIGVLRSLGARKLDVANLFNAETGIIGTISGSLGVLLAWLIDFPLNAWIASISPDFPKNFAVLNPIHAVILIALSIGLTVLSGLLPAMLAARKDPVKALRASG